MSACAYSPADYWDSITASPSAYPTEQLHGALFHARLELVAAERTAKWAAALDRDDTPEAPRWEREARARADRWRRTVDAVSLELQGRAGEVRP